MKRILCGVLLLILGLPLSGCQLASDRGEDSEDQLVGVFVTTEYLDLMDMDAYLNDHLNELTDGGTITMEGDTSAYQERVYAVDVSEDPQNPDYRFPGIEGVPIYSVPVPEPEGDDYCWTPSNAPEAWQYYNYTVEDDMEGMVITAELYVSTEKRHHQFYANPMYRTAEGEIYLVGGTGAGGDMDELGTSLTLTVEETSDMTLNGETTRQRCEVKVTVTSVYPVEKTVLIQMDGNNRVIASQEFLPAQAPAEFTPESNTAYLLVETHRQSQSGDQTVDRELFDWEDTVFSTYQEGENSFFCRTYTVIHWPE